MTVAGAAGTKSRRIYFLDLLRIISCFFVIVNHTNSDIFLEREPHLTWFVSLAYFFCSKVAVPIFIMISGYTLLNRQDSYAKSFERFVRYGCTLLIFSAVYYLSDRWSGEAPFGWKGFLMSLFGEPYTYAFWYMYTYLGILLMLPLLQRLASAMTKEDHHWLFFWSILICSVWPILAHYVPELSIYSAFSVPLFNSYIMLLMMGHYIRTYCVPSTKWRIPCLLGYIGTTALNVFATYAEYVRLDGTDYLFYDERTLVPVVAGAVCLFGFFATLDMKESIGKVTTEIGKLTFGIYLISDLLIEKLKFIYLYLVEQQMHILLAMVIYEVCVFALGALIIYLLRKIPPVRKFL